MGISQSFIRIKFDHHHMIARAIVPPLHTIWYSSAGKVPRENLQVTYYHKNNKNIE